MTFSKNVSAIKGSHRSGGDGIRARKSIELRKKPSGSTASQNSGAERPLKIGEAANLVGVEPYVLRFWETQFSCIRPKQSRSRHRYYSPTDIETLRYVKYLLHTEGYTIAGARRFIRERGLDGVKDAVTTNPRPSSSHKAKERNISNAASRPDVQLTAARNRVDRALRKILEDLRAIHKMLDTR
ncbi:MAG: MerR family transcriptional regulator [Deltaproteobacteria bacterium]|nr:MerR family transcriptional regulator [Deltaproteobacteria bacterium]